MNIALTGGIGSGKSYVCSLLCDFGIDVYDCDAAAKRLIRTSRELQAQLSDAVGVDLFEGGRFNKAALSRFIVASEANAAKIDSIVHPAVAEDYKKSGYQWLESAILFESKFNERVDFDYVVCVTAPLEVRIQRVMLRDNLSRERALEWIERQMTQEEKVSRSDFEIVNDGTKDVTLQLRELMINVNKQIKRI